MSENIKIYSCKICNKFYSSQSSLCNHNKKIWGFKYSDVFFIIKKN